MIQDIIVLLAIGVLGIAITLFAWTDRRKVWDNFRLWWDVEGWPIFLIASAFLAIIAAAMGCFRSFG